MFLLTGGKGRHPERQTSNPTSSWMCSPILQGIRTVSYPRNPPLQGLKLGIASRNLSRSKLHDLDVGTCCLGGYMVATKISVASPRHHNTPVKGEFLLSSQLLPVMGTGQDSAAAPFLLAATLSSLMVFFLSAPFFLSLSFFLKGAI